MVHQYRDVCGHLEWGSRTIAHKIAQLGLEISRSTVQRILREDKPKRPTRSRATADGSGAKATAHILCPKKRNRTWHVDLTVLIVFGMRFHVAAVLDGFSRKLLALKIYARTPTALMMVKPIRVHDPQPEFSVTRRWFRGDRHLSVVEVTVAEPAA